MVRLKQKFIWGHLILGPPKIALNVVFPLYMKTLDIYAFLRSKWNCTLSSHYLCECETTYIINSFLQVTGLFWAKKPKTKTKKPKQKPGQILPAVFQILFFKHRIHSSNCILLVEAQSMKHTECLIYLTDNWGAVHNTLLATLGFRMRYLFLMESSPLSFLMRILRSGESDPLRVTGI